MKAPRSHPLCNREKTVSDKCQHWSRESGYAQASLYAACPWCELESLRRQNERLAAALFRHACYCGCGSPEPGLHREDCAYRVACTPEAQL